MATAVGTYVTKTSAKLRLLTAGESDTSNDTLIQVICDEVNQFVEGKANRVLSPIPAFSSTLSGAAGSQQVTIADATGLAVGDDLLVGPLSGTHESTSVMYVAGATGTGNVWIDAPLGATYTLAKAQRIYVQDGHDSLDYGRRLIVPRGIIMLAALEVAPYSGGPWGLASQSDYFLRPSGPDLSPGWPFTEVVWTDVPTGGTPFPTFYPGFGNIRLIGPGPCVASGMPALPFAGWPAVPDDVKGIAESLFLSAWRERSSSGGDSMTVNLDGSRVYERALSYEQKRTLERYRVKSAQAV